jgi:ribosome biogenesis GTPase A
MKMHDFWRIVDRVIYESDIVLEVIDARMPNLTRNKKVENKVRRKRKFLILVMNKSDLITRKMKMNFLQKFKSKEVIFVSCKQRIGILALKEKILKLAKKIRYSNDIKVGVVGYPNTGKSTVINTLSGRSAAKTSPIAGLTRGVQWIRGEGNIMFFDTPGVIPLDEKDETEQALMTIIDPNKLKNPDLAAMRVIQLFLDNNKKSLEKFYGVRIESDDTFEVLLGIGKRKNFLWKGGKVDEVRTALTIIRDWQRGNLLLNTDENVRIERVKST